jgi:hypothetical protein
MDPRTTRGFLNNNPGNMDRATGAPWQGEIRDTVDARLTEFQRKELTSGRFAVFTSPEWGIRALAKNLFAYRDRLNRRTVREIINTWAPPVENDTGAYVNVVAKRVGVGPNEPIDLRDYKTLHALVSAIIIHECAGMPYKGDEIDEGLRLAGVVKPATVSTSGTMKGAATIAVSTAAQQVIPAIQEPITQVAVALEPMAGTTAYVDYMLIGLKVLLACVALYGVWMVVRSRKAGAASDARVGDVTAEVGK